MKIQESEEMYLETILLLRNINPNVRSVDVATKLNYSRPSVSRAMGLLKDKDYITILDNGIILLTPKGEERAKDIYERHMIITKLLTYVGADSVTAEENACRIEHVISADMFQILKDFSKNKNIK